MNLAQSVIILENIQINHQKHPQFVNILKQNKFIMNQISFTQRPEYRLIHEIPKILWIYLTFIKFVRYNIYRYNDITQTITQQLNQLQSLSQIYLLMLRQALIAGLILTSIVMVSYYHQQTISDNLQRVAADGKVKVDLYSESLCPDCLAFITKSLKTAVNTKDFWKICEFNFYPYGNGKRVQNGSSWAFTCQHGVKECQGNLIEACAIRKYDYYTLGLPFALCLEDNTTDFTAQGQRCASKYGLSWAQINTCATGAEGNKYMYEIAVATEKLNPAHAYVPWIVVNDRHSTTSENAIIKNMVSYVCSIYTGSERIAACGK